MLTQEGADILSGILTSDLERAKDILTMQSAGEVLAQINALGYGFTLSDIKDYGLALRAAAVQGGGLCATSLDFASGGVDIEPAIAALATAAIGCIPDNGAGENLAW